MQRLDVADNDGDWTKTLLILFIRAAANCKIAKTLGTPERWSGYSSAPDGSRKRRGVFVTVWPDCCGGLSRQNLSIIYCAQWLTETERSSLDSTVSPWIFMLSLITRKHKRKRATQSGQLHHTPYEWVLNLNECKSWMDIKKGGHLKLVTAVVCVCVWWWNSIFFIEKLSNFHIFSG